MAENTETLTLLRSLLLGKRVSSIKDGVLHVDIGCDTSMTVEFYESASDGCAHASAQWTLPVDYGVITDVRWEEIPASESKRPEYGIAMEDHELRISILGEHNGIITQYDCLATTGSGYYMSVLSVRVKSISYDPYDIDAEPVSRVILDNDILSTR